MAHASCVFRSASCGTVFPPRNRPSKNPPTHANVNLETDLPPRGEDLETWGEVGEKYGQTSRKDAGGCTLEACATRSHPESFPFPASITIFSRARIFRPAPKDSRAAFPGAGILPVMADGLPSEAGRLVSYQKPLTCQYGSARP